MKLPIENYEFPSDWIVSPVSDVANFSRGVSWGKAEEAPEGKGLLVISIPNIKDGRIDYETKFNHYLSKDVTAAKRLNVGDIIFVGSSGSIHNVGRNARVSALPNGSVAFASFTFKAAPKSEAIDGEFFYYLVNSDIVPFPPFCKRAADGKFNFQLRDFVNRLVIPIPPIPEQKKIAYILSSVQQAIEAQERIIQTTTELKKALMHKLFTEGLRNEPQKQTEIGPIPENWEIIELGELLSRTQYGLSVKGNADGKYPILRMTNQVAGHIVDSNLQYVEITDPEFQRFRVDFGDILFNRTNSFDLVGRTAICDIDGDFVFASYLIRLSTIKEKLDSFYLNCYFNMDETQLRLKSIATRAVSQSNISATRLKGFVVPVPSLEEQQELVSHARALDLKIFIHSRKLAELRDLFRTLLHELMTAKIRVNDIDFDDIEELERV